jgi:hypothetical protein
MKLNMSVFEMIRSEDTVLMKAAQHLIRKSKVREETGLSIEQIEKIAQKHLKELEHIRRSIYGEFQDNNILFMYLVTLLENIELAHCLHQLAKDQASPSVPFAGP